MAVKNGKIKEIWGRQFNIVKNGLDEAEVFSFISRLIEQNADLSRKLEHIDSLKKLAEKAVIQAAKQAQRIKSEAQEQASEEVETVVSQAREASQLESERIIAETESSAQAKLEESEQLAQQMLADAEEQAAEKAQMIISETEEKTRAESERIIAETMQMAESTAQERIASAEERASRIIKEAEEKADSVTSPAAEEANALLDEAKRKSESAEQLAQQIMAEAQEKAEAIRKLAEEESNKLIAEIKQESERSAEIRIAKAEEEGRRIIEEATGAAAMEAERIKEEAEQFSGRGQSAGEAQLKEKFDMLCDILLSNSLGARERPAPRNHRTEEYIEEDLDLYKGTVELDFPPPLDSNRVLKVHKQLSKIPNIRILDIKGSARGGIRITLLLRNSVPLLDVLKEMPEIEQVTNGVKPSGQSSLPQKHGETAPRKIVVTTRR